MQAVIYHVEDADEDESLLQREALNEALERDGHSLAAIFLDASSLQGVKRKKRPGFTSMMQKLPILAIDYLYVWSITSVSSSVPDLNQFCDDVQVFIPTIVFQKEALTTNDDWYEWLSVYAEITTEYHKVRMKPVAEKALREGKITGRPPIPDKIRKKVFELKEEGVGPTEIARLTGIGRNAVYNILTSFAHLYTSK